MALESGVTYIEDLVSTNPVGATDDVEEGDDHIRNIKTAVKGSFPNLGAAAVTKTAAEINDLATITGTETLTDKTLASPVIDTGISGTAIDTTTLTDSATLVPSSSVVTDKTANLNTKIIEIGTWNMDTTITVTIAHGLTLSKIRTIKAIIRRDADDNYSDFPRQAAGASGTDILTSDATNIQLSRGLAGAFDNSNYDTMSGDGNRGWITIQYTD